jgi:hypothetical protein
VAIALNFLSAAIQSTAQPDPKKPDRKPQQLAAELVGQSEVRQAPGPLGIVVNGGFGPAVAIGGEILGAMDEELRNCKLTFAAIRNC